MSFQTIALKMVSTPFTGGDAKREPHANQINIPKIINVRLATNDCQSISTSINFDFTCTKPIF